jgi:hypothetical protein
VEPQAVHAPLGINAGIQRQDENDAHGNWSN